MVVEMAHLVVFVGQKMAVYGLLVKLTAKEYK